MATERTLTVAPAVAAAASVHAAVTLSTVQQIVTSAITNPDVGRVASITGSAAGIAGDVVISGTDQNGDAATDTLALSGTSTVAGVVAFATVTSITLPGRTHASGDTVSVGCGNVFGLPGTIGKTADVTGAERKPSGGSYTSETVGTVNVDHGTVTSTIVAGDTMLWTYLSADEVDVDELRQMTAEPTTATYSDGDLIAILQKFALIDSDGLEPDDTDWVPTYDLNAAAANVWRKKAAALASLYDFTADGGTFHRSQAYKQAMAQARHYNSMRAPSSLRVHIAQDYERDYQSTYWTKGDTDYIVNRAEDD